MFSFFKQKTKKTKPVIQILNEILELEGVQKLSLSGSKMEPKAKTNVETKIEAETKAETKAETETETFTFDDDISKGVQQDLIGIIKQMNTILRLPELGLYTQVDDVEGQLNTVVATSGEIDDEGNETRNDIQYIKVPPLVPQTYV